MHCHAVGSVTDVITGAVKELSTMHTWFFKLLLTA